MVEIVLAIAILAFGFASILGLFPVAIKMVRNSQTETLVADAIGDLQSYYYSIANIPLIDSTGKQVNNEYWYAFLFYPKSADKTTLMASLPTYTTYNNIDFFLDSDLDNGKKVRDNARGKDSTYPELYGPAFLEKLKKAVASDKDLTKSTDNPAFDAPESSPELGLVQNLNLFRPTLSGKYQSFYLVNGEDGFRRITSTAQLLVWISPIDKFYPPTATSLASPAIDYKYGVVLNIEASWPINVPYDEREKRFYQFIIANPKKI